MAHGLDGALEKPDWPPIQLAEVDRLLRRYPEATEATEVLSHSPRPFSAASVIATRHGKVFVKRHHVSVRSEEGLTEEHRFMSHLAINWPQKPPLVLPPLSDEEGKTAVTLGEWTWEVHPVARGTDVYEQALSWTPFQHSSHAFAAGRALAQLHAASMRFDAPARTGQQLVTSFSIFAGPISTDPTVQMQDYLAIRPNLKTYAERRHWQDSFDSLFMPLYSKLHPWLAQIPQLWTHNDFHASNLMWSAGSEAAEVTGIIDFGLADRTNAVHDIATAIERNVIEWLRIDEPAAQLIHLDHLDALLDGYESVRPLTPAEAQALPAMLPLVHCEFALSETDYFLSILHDEDKAYLAYEGYFLAHTQWFASPQGRAILEHLQRRADQSGLSEVRQ